MHGEIRLRFRIERPGLEPQELDVDAARALIGSGAHCEVRLDARDATAEQLRVSATPAELTAECRSPSALTLLEGAPFTGGPLADGAVFTIGECRVRVERQHAPSAASRESRVGRWASLALGLLVATVGATLLLEPAPAGALPERPQIPPLYSPAEAQACPRVAPGEAQQLAHELWQEAQLKRQRSFYYLKDAMAAVVAFRRSAACFAQAGAVAPAARAELEFERLLLQLAADYHRRHILLQRALESNDWYTVQREAAALWELLGERQPEYTNWLSSVVRLAVARAAAERKK
jgi:hypothetical protein